jgi:predicted aconitase with swiveling domain
VGQKLSAKIIVAGEAEGKALVSREPLSFWGGVSAKTGEIIDQRHELCGQSVTGRIFAFPGGKGSSTASAVLLETVRAGLAPAAIINIKVDPILALGSVIAEELYGKSVPILLLLEESFFSIKQGDTVRLEPDGSVIVNPSQL